MLFGVSVSAQQYSSCVMSVMQVLGADGLLYQSINDLLAVAQKLNPDIDQFEASCFTGRSPLQQWSMAQ